MAELKTTYGTTTSIAATGITTLANAGTVTSSTVDNTTDLFLDAILAVVVTHTAAPSASGFVEIYIKGSIDNSEFDDDNNAKWGASLVMVTTTATTRKRVLSVASAFGGAMPPYWQVFIRNSSGAAFSAATLAYRGLKAQSV